MSDLEAVLEAASPGPWQLTQGPDGTDSAPWGLASADNYEVVWRGMWEPDARLAALAPDLARKVLDQREAGQTMYEALDEVLPSEDVLAQIQPSQSIQLYMKAADWRRLRKALRPRDD